MALNGDKKASAVYGAVGLALDRWERCDMSFAMVYAALVHPERSNHILMRAYGTITAPNTKRSMIVEACDTFFAIYSDDATYKQVLHLLNLYGHGSARRNEIAHAIVSSELTHTIVDGKAVPLPSPWFLTPPIFSTRKNEAFHAGVKYRYSSAEISHFTKCFAELGARASRISHTVREIYYSSPQKLG